MCLLQVLHSALHGRQEAVKSVTAPEELQHASSDAPNQDGCAYGRACDDCITCGCQLVELSAKRHKVDQDALDDSITT